MDSALKIARAYWKKRGKGSKTKLIGRAKGYHGVNFGGISVGGIGANRALYGEGIASDHLAHTLLEQNLFSRGLPEQGAELANELEQKYCSTALTTLRRSLLNLSRAALASFLHRLVT